MLLFGVILVMFLAAGIITILARRRPGIGSTWMIASGVSLLAWLVLAGSPTRLFPEVSFNALLPGQSQFLDLTFRLDRDAWQYSFAIIALNVAMLFTSSARIHARNESFIWAGSLILTAIGVLACSSISPLSLILAWTLLDFAELAFILLIRADRRIESSSLASFTWRVFGTLIFAGVFILAGTQGELPSFKGISPVYFPAILLAVLLRLGVFPLHPSVSRFSPINRSAGNAINLIAPASALVFLGRLKGEYPQGDLLIALLIAFTLLYALYAASKWSGSVAELNGRAFWVVSLAIFALTCTLNGQSQYAPVWGMMLLLGGGGLFLASPRNKWIATLLMVIFFGISGIPGSPSMSAWNGIIQNTSFMITPLLMVTAAILFYGYLKFAQVLEGDFVGVDRWVKVIYPTGLGILVISQWVIFIRNLPASFTFIYWWCGVIVVALALIIFLWKQNFLPQSINQITKKVAIPKILNMEARMDVFFGMGWFTKASGFVFGLVQWLMNLIAGVLEGQGGILWAILLLALLISYFQFGIKP